MAAEINLYILHMASKTAHPHPSGLNVYAPLSYLDYQYLNYNNK